MSEIGNLLARWAEAWNAHDPDAVASFYAETATFRTSKALFEGREAIAGLAAATFAAAPDFRLEVRRLVVDGHVAVAEAVELRTLAVERRFRLDDGTEVDGRGRLWRIEFAEVFVFDGERILEDRSYAGPSTLDGVPVTPL